MGHEEPRVDIIDRPKPLVAVASKSGTDLFELDGSSLRLQRQLECTHVQSRRGAFGCSGAAGRVVRGAEDTDFRRVADAYPSGLGVTPLGLTSNGAVHVGLRELAEAPHVPAVPRTSAAEPTRPVGRLTCTTQSPAKAVKKLAQSRSRYDDSFDLPDGWFGVERSDAAVALKIEGSGSATKWRFRWQSLPMQPGVLEARLDAPIEKRPSLGSFAIHRGTLALVVYTERDSWVVGARNGSATLTPARQPKVSAVSAGHDGAVAWTDQPSVVLAPPGKSGAVAFTPSPTSLSTPSSEGVWLVFRSGSFDAKPGGPQALTPSLFQPGLSIRSLERSLPEMAPCPKGARGRTFELPDSHPIQSVVDGKPQRARFGRVDVLLDHPSPCLAVVRSGEITVDFLEARTRTVSEDQIAELECIWGPPEG